MGARYTRYVAVAGLTALLGFALYLTLTNRGLRPGVPAGERLPPFAAPLALGGVPGAYVNVALHANEGQAGKHPACSIRGAGILNVCQLYERGPVVLALFIDGGSCPAVLERLAQLVPRYPHVRFAAVAVKAQAHQVARLARSLPFPLAVDRDGVLGSLYGMAGCAQVTFADRGGTVRGQALLEDPSQALLARRVRELSVADAGAS